jgi:maltose alpha-D-glucosyltransferase/alpha-amylase
VGHNENNMSAQDNNQWWLQGNFYSLYIDKFAGTIPGLVDRLEYFTELGIDCLHILPYYPSPMRDGGFDITDHIGVRPELGTVDDFKRLCESAHSQGLKIMVDLVLNHVSEDHPWFKEARSSKENPKRDWFLWSDTGTEYADAPIIFPDFKEHNWVRNEPTGDFYYATFKPSQPDLNWSNPEVQKATIAIVDTLIAYGVDGFRLDAIMNLVEQDHTTSVGLPETHARIKDIRAHIDAYHPGTILLGEVVDLTGPSRQYFGDGDECHLSYNFELMNEMLYALVCGTGTDRLRTVIEASRALPPNASWMSFLRNHDSVYFVSLNQSQRESFLKKIDPKSTYSFARGRETAQRLSNILSNDHVAIPEAFNMLYALPTATVMYYGDEIGMQNVPLPEGEDDMRTVVRGQFDWKEAERQQQDPHSLFHHVKKQIARRRKEFANK